MFLTVRTRWSSRSNFTDFAWYLVGIVRIEKRVSEALASPFGGFGVVTSFARFAVLLYGRGAGLERTLPWLVSVSRLSLSLSCCLVRLVTSGGRRGRLVGR